MAKVKIVQIENFYPAFIEQYYTRFPALSSLSYASQLQVLLDSGWSSGQNVVPYLNPAKYDAHYIIPSFSSLQKIWAAENGLNQSEITADQILLNQLEKIKPDIIYLSDVFCFNFEILKFLSKKPLVMCWHATALAPDISWGLIDVLLSGVGSIRKQASALGARATEEFMSGAPNFQQKNKLQIIGIGDTCFSGSFIGGLHTERAKLFYDTAMAVAPHNFDIYTSNPFPRADAVNMRFGNAVYASDVINLYANYKVVVDARADFGLKDNSFTGETSNMRIFEATKAGCLLLTQASNNLSKYFEIDKEIVTYESKEELCDKLKFYLDPKNESLRKLIAENGHIKTIGSHSIESRALWFSKILDKYLNK